MRSVNASKSEKRNQPDVNIAEDHPVKLSYARLQKKTYR